MQENPDAGTVTKGSSAFWFVPLAAFVVLADEWTKKWALGALPDESTIQHPSAIAFAIHKNWGIAFDIPFKMPLIIVISVLIGLALFWVAALNFRARPAVAASSAVIVLGAAGNLYDRVAYGFTVDYVILLGRSAVNLSDVVIVSGVVALLYSSRDARTVDAHDHSV
jgi:signal peptidase II